MGKLRYLIVRLSVSIRDFGDWLYDTQIPNDYSFPTKCDHCGKWSFEPKEDTPND